MSRRPATIVAIAALLSVLAAGCSYELRDVSFDVEELTTAQSSRVYDRNGVLITELRGEQRRTDVTDIALVPEVVRNAVVAIEDERFYEHDGADLKAILRAARSNVAAGGISQGGSTITQQYVGNVFLDRSETTLTRKVEEFFMARRFEQFFTKDFILLRYLNWVYFGNGAYGIEAAARQYFGAPACELATTAAERGSEACLKVTELTLEQAALLAGLIQRPSAFDPYRNPQDARRRRNLVLERMLVNGFITNDEYDRAYNEPIVLIEDIPIFEERYPAAHFVEDVKQWFLDNDAFGPTREYRTQLLFEGGLDIHTTIDLGLQARAEATVEAILPDNGINPDAAATVLGVGGAEDGHVLAMVGGRDFFGDDTDAKFNLASGKGRQAGSAMKPIALAEALTRGFTVTKSYDAPDELEIDRPDVCGPLWTIRGGLGSEPETPVEANLIAATQRSINTVYAQLMVDIRPANFVTMAERLGLEASRIAPVCAGVLGTEDVNTVELATMFSTFARSGRRSRTGAGDQRHPVRRHRAVPPCQRRSARARFRHRQPDHLGASGIDHPGHRTPGGHRPSGRRQDGYGPELRRRDLRGIHAATGGGGVGRLPRRPDPDGSPTTDIRVSGGTLPGPDLARDHDRGPRGNPGRQPARSAGQRARRPPPPRRRSTRSRSPIWWAGPGMPAAGSG